MKVLWFTLSPCGASAKLNPLQVTNGWLASLEKQINVDVELAISFYTYEKMRPFKIGNTKYYPLYKGYKKNKINLLIDNIRRTFFKSDDITDCLRIVEDFEPDIIHVHGTEEKFGLIQNYCNCPVLISIQGLLSPYSEKYFSGISLRQATLYESWINKIAFKSTKRYFSFFCKNAKRERQILRQAKYIMGRTSWDYRITRLLAPNSIYYVGNEILRDSFYNLKWEKEEKSHTSIITTIVSGGHYKGVESILLTAKYLKEYNIKFQWNVVGLSKASDIVKLVENIYKEHFDQNNIILLGRKDEKGIVDILLQTDIYCQVSHIENSPNSLCEAMLIGMPIVATFAGGTDSILNNGVDGVLVQDGDNYSIAGAIKELILNETLAKKYANSAYITAQKRHDKKAIKQQVLFSYQDILSKSMG